jgi:hypothetical protein
MPHFLIVYDRSAGKRLQLREFSDGERDEASCARFAMEDQQRSNPDVEVVLLSSTSRQAIERTHARYFKTLEELARDP